MFKELKEHQESSDVHKINCRKDKQPRNSDKKFRQPDDLINKCKFCSSHPRRNCPAYGKRCHIPREKSLWSLLSSQKKSNVLLRTLQRIAPLVSTMNFTLLWSPLTVPVPPPPILWTALCLSKHPVQTNKNIHNWRKLGVVRHNGNGMVLMYLSDWYWCSMQCYPKAYPSKFVTSSNHGITYGGIHGQWFQTYGPKFQTFYQRVGL